MPRFKQPLQGLSRLTDALGGSAGIFPTTVRNGSVGSGSVRNITAIESGDIIVAFASAASSSLPTLPAAYISVATALSGTDGMRAGYTVATGTSYSATYPSDTAYIVLRGSRGIGNVGVIQEAASTVANLPEVTGTQKNSRVVSGLVRSVSAASSTSLALLTSGVAMGNANLFVAINASTGGLVPTIPLTYNVSSLRVAISVEVLSS